MCDVMDSNPSVGLASAEHIYRAEGEVHTHPEYEKLRKYKQDNVDPGLHKGIDILLWWLDQGLHPNIIGEPSFVMLRKELIEKVVSLKTRVMGPGLLRLTTEIEFHGSFLLDLEQMKRDANKIRNGQEDPLPVLVDTAERTVRIVGKEINELEKKLHAAFPELSSIDLEVN